MAVATFFVSTTLGFEACAAEWKGNLSFDLGVFKLSAWQGLNRYFQYLVTFGGVLSTSWTISDVYFDLPRHVVSKDQCVAFVAY